MPRSLGRGVGNRATPRGAAAVTLRALSPGTPIVTLCAGGVVVGTLSHWEGFPFSFRFPCCNRWQRWGLVGCRPPRASWVCCFSFLSRFRVGLSGFRLSSVAVSDALPGPDPYPGG